MAEKKYLIDLSEVTTKEALHGALKDTLSFPDHYGANLDALHDCLTDLAVSGTAEEPVVVTVAGYKKAKKALEKEFYGFREVLDDVSDEYDHFFVLWRRRA